MDCQTTNSGLSLLTHACCLGYKANWDIFAIHTALRVDTKANIGYGLLLQDMARLSEYFCEKANAGGLVGVLLVTVKNYRNMLVCKVT